MKIALISPKGPLYRHRGGIFRKSLRYAPLTLTTLASLVPEDLNASVEIYDEGIGSLPESIDADLIGMTVITGTAPRAYELAARFGRQSIPVVLGGPHVTLVPEDAQPHADSIVCGYAEDTWPALLRDFSVGKLKARYTQDAGLSLAGQPFPLRKMLPRRSYSTLNVFEATRGCIHACEFCVVPSAWGRKPYQKPIGDVIADIRQMGAKRLIFIDLNLIADRSYAMELFNALKPERVRWFGLATTLIGRDDELLETAASSGCRGLLVGLESANAGTLSSLRKGFNRPDNYGELVRKLHSYGIALQGCFVFGHDEDDSTVFQQSAELAVEFKIDLPRFAILTPFPGTPLYRKLDSEGRILTRNWELYDGQHVVHQPKQMTPHELEQGTKRAWEYVYRYSSMAKRLNYSWRQLPLRVLANFGYRYYARRLDRFYTCDWITGFDVGGTKELKPAKAG